MREMSNDLSDLKKLFSELPEVTLPQSLTAESLFARMDAQAEEEHPGEGGEQTAVAASKPGGVKLLDLTRRLRPVLSYAAVFALLVFVYYSAGLQNNSSAAPMQTPQMNDKAAASSVAADEESSSSSMAAAEMYSLDESQLSGEQEAAQIAESGFAPASAQGVSSPDAYAYYRELAVELSQQAAGRSAMGKISRNHSFVTETNNDSYTVRVKPDTAGGSRLELFDLQGRDLLGSIVTEGGPVLELELGIDSLNVVELLEPGRVSYDGDAWLPLMDDGAAVDQSKVPDCGAVRLSVYDISDPANITLRSSMLQEGDHAFSLVTGSDTAQPMLLTATIKELLPVQTGAPLCYVVPMLGQTALDTPLEGGLVVRYPEGPHNQFMLLTVMDAQGVSQSAAVLGSGLLIQNVGRSEFVVFSDSQPDAKAIDTLELNQVTIELR